MKQSLRRVWNEFGKYFEDEFEKKLKWIWEDVENEFEKCFEGAFKGILKWVIWKAVGKRISKWGFDKKCVQDGF